MNSHLTINSFAFNRYLSKLLYMYMIVRDFQNSVVQQWVLRYIFYGFVDVSAQTHNPIQTLILQIWLFSLVFNAMQLLCLWLSSLPDIALWTLSLDRGSNENNNICWLQPIFSSSCTCTLSLLLYFKSWTNLHSDIYHSSTLNSTFFIGIYK